MIMNSFATTAIIGSLLHQKSNLKPKSQILQTQLMQWYASQDQYYGITGKDVDTSTMDGSLPLPLLKKLSEPNECAVRLRAEMNNYGGLNQCRFIVLAIFDSSPTTTSATSKHSLMLDPPTPQKKSKHEESITETSSINSGSRSPDSNNDMNSEATHQIKPKTD